MKTLFILTALLLPCFAHAEEPIRFVAEVSDEALAEDAILLVHCLATRLQRGWELGGEARGPVWLKVMEKEHRLTAQFHQDPGEKTVSFRAGESDSACEALVPASAAPPSTTPAPSPLAALAPLPALSTIPPGELVAAADGDAHQTKTWLWVGGGIAVLAGGFLLYRAHAHRPDYGALQMN